MAMAAAPPTAAKVVFSYPYALSPAHGGFNLLLDPFQVE